MATSIYSQLSPAARRAQIERIVIEYPDISEAELYDVFQYFRTDATLRDKRRFASDPKLRKPYRRLCREHRLDRLGMIGTVLGRAFVALVILGIVFLALGMFE